MKAHGPYTWKLRNYFDKTINDQEEDKDNPPKVKNQNNLGLYSIKNFDLAGFKLGALERKTRTILITA